MLTELTIKEFINKVISNDPVPGGGSVSALNGALAAAHDAQDGYRCSEYPYPSRTERHRPYSW